MKTFFKTYKLQIFIVLAAIGLYANTLHHDYTLDDPYVIADNHATLKGIAGIPNILANEGLDRGYGLYPGGRYRPMSQISFAIEYQFFGLNPMVGHLMNILYYALTCLLVFLTLRRVFNRGTVVETRHATSLLGATNNYLTIPFIATMLFAAHPLHTEVVANIKGRDEIFALLGALGALFLALKYVERPRKATLAGMFLAFLFGVSSKESALTFIAVIPLTIYLFMDARKPRQYRDVMIVLGVAAAMFLGIRYYALHFLTYGDLATPSILGNPYFHSTLGQQIATTIYTWLLYIKLLFFPYPLTHDYHPYHIPILDFGDFRVWLSLAIVVFLAYYAIKNFKKNSVVSYGILFFGLTFSMTCGLISHAGTFMGERYIYTPSLGFAVVVGWFVQRMALRKTRGLVAVLILVFVVLSAATIHRNRAWENNLTLYTTDIKTSKNSIFSNLHTGELLGEHYVETLTSVAEQKKVLNQAYTYLHKGLQMYPDYPWGWVRLGTYCLRLGRYEEALEIFSRDLNNDPKKNSFSIVLQAAQELFHQGQTGIAAKFYALALRHCVDGTQRLFILVEYHLCEQDLDAAMRILDQILIHEPDNVWARDLRAELAG